MRPLAPRKTRIGLYMFTPMLGGAELYFKQLLWELPRARYDVTLFVESWPEFAEFLELAKCRDVRIRYVKVLEPVGHISSKGTPAAPSLLRRVAILALKWLLVPLNVARLYAAFRKNPVDILHINNGGYPGAQTALLAAVAARMAGCGHRVMTVCNVPVPPMFPKPLERGLDNVVRGSLDKVVVPSSLVAQSMERLRGYRPEQFDIIKYATSDPTANVNGSERTVGGVLLGMVASFLPHKGHRYIIEAMSQLAKEFPNVSLVLIGDGPTRPSMEKLAADFGVSDRIRFTGFCSLPETHRWMNQFDIAVHSSDMEGMPYVIIDAMGLGKPIAASAVGGVPDQIVDGQNGFLLPPGNVSALTQALRALIADPELRQRMGAASRKRYEGCFALPAMISNHDRLYQSLLEPEASNTHPVEGARKL